jgi:hypothetical protein
MPHRLKELLVQFTFEPQAFIRAWNDRGWLEIGRPSGDKEVRIDGEQTWTVAIRRSAVEEMEGTDDLITDW